MRWSRVGVVLGATFAVAFGVSWATEDGIREQETRVLRVLVASPRAAALRDSIGRAVRATAIADAGRMTLGLPIGAPASGSLFESISSGPAVPPRRGDSISVTVGTGTVTRRDVDASASAHAAVRLDTMLPATGWRRLVGDGLVYVEGVVIGTATCRVRSAVATVGDTTCTVDTHVGPWPDITHARAQTPEGSRPLPRPGPR